MLARWRKEGMPRSDAGGWLRMNPVDGHGISDLNITSLRFMLLESDVLPLNLQLPLFARLELPISAIMSTGGRGYHAWVRLDASNRDEFRRWGTKVYQALRKLGIDPKNGNPSRLSRLPGARRVIGGAGDGI